jgi:threonine synthase
MNYLSTRGASSVSAAAAIRHGIAPDGGLYTPEQIPVLDETKLRGMIGQTYQEIAAAIIGMYLTDYQPADLKEMIAAAYAAPAKFETAAVTPVVKLRDRQYILELWHGPTCAFKDVALQLLPHLMTKASELCHDPNEIVILVATSGDTGKAALEGFKDVPGTKIVVFFPEEGVSTIQRLQMVTQEGQNTYVIAVKGNFDDAQSGVKQLFTAPAMIEKLQDYQMSFSSANSINWGRLVPQIVYYFYSYMELCRRGELSYGEKLNVNVPTGNFGNILAAYFAKEMGLPLGKLICSSNSNNVLTEFIATGVYNRNRPFFTTASPSMDILISSNLERLLYYLSGKNSQAVAEWMESLKNEGRYRVDPETAARIKGLFYGGFASEIDTLVTIKQVYDSTGTVLDTHTAVGEAVYEKYCLTTGDNTPVLLVATASPFKFNASVVRAISGADAVQGKTEFELLEQLAALSGLTVPAGLKKLDQKPVRHQTVCETGDLGPAVEEFLKI